MDFTEFLNTPGCAKGKHSNEKPEEPEHITGQIGESNDIELPQVNNTPRESIESKIHLPRPEFAKAPLLRIKPTIAKSLSEAAKTLETVEADSNQGTLIGEPCKNGGCKEVSISTRLFFILGLHKCEYSVHFFPHENG